MRLALSEPTLLDAGPHNNPQYHGDQQTKEHPQQNGGKPQMRHQGSKRGEQGF